jgi:hypothetical protein
MPFLRRLNLPLVTLVAGVAVTLAVLASRVRDWVVMTDELQYAKLASAIADGSLLPTLRGVHVSAYAQLYPLLLSPLYALLDAPGAFEAAHVLNGALYASAAVPAYLLGRAARLSRPWSTLVAALTLAAPWNVLAAFLLTEPAAYPVFLWVLLACERALAVPSDWHDALAVAALGLAVLARTQFVVLVLVLPLAVAILDQTRALRRHRVLAATYAVGALAAAVVALTGGLARLLGRYEVTVTKGSLLPFDAVVHAGAHVDLVGLAIGLVPLLLGGAWLVTRRTPFSVLALVTIVALTLETSSYDARFASGLTPVRDRYLFYLAPLLLVATACALRDGVQRLALAGVTAFVAITIFAYDFVEVSGIYVDSPISVAGGEFERSGGAAFVAVIAIVIFLALVVPAPASARAAAVALVVAASSLTLSGATWTRLLTARAPSGRAVTDGPAFVRDWIDRALPAGSTVALMPYPVGQEWSLSAIFWWDIELWNDSAQRVYVVGGEWEYAPFPNRELGVDPITGRVRGTIDAPAYVVAAAGDTRLRLAGVVHTSKIGLYILRAERPYRAEWMTRGLDPDGYTVAGRRVLIHIFAEPGQGPELVKLKLSFAAPPGAVAFRVGDQERELAAGASAPERFDVCVPPPYGANVALEVTRAVRGAGPPFAPGREQSKRNVGPRVTGVAVARRREPC